MTKEEVLKIMQDSVKYDDVEGIVGFEDAAEKITHTEAVASDIDFRDSISGFLMVDGVVDGKPAKVLDKESLGILREVAGKCGCVVFEKEDLVHKIASFRLVPGNEARNMVEKLVK